MSADKPGSFLDRFLPEEFRKKAGELARDIASTAIDSWLARNREHMRNMQPEAELSASDYGGMGANLTPEGVSFRVWAPHAEKVFVLGNFNDWHGEQYPLTHEGDGYWSTMVPEVQAGAEYKFRIMNGDMDMMRNDPYARQVTNSVGNSVVVDPSFDWNNDFYRTPPWNEMVIYEMHVGTFHPTGEHLPASFDDAIQKLPYLLGLGINVIQVMPPMEFPGGVSWGYNPAHLFSIESGYGGPSAFKRFIQAAHEHGIAIVLDVVYNHFGPNDLDLWRFDGWSENDKGGIYFYSDDRSRTPWGDTRPDYGRPEVRQFIRDNVLMWLEEYHVDGLRFDATSYMRSVDGNGGPDERMKEGWDLLRWLNDEINARQPWKITIAEDLRSDASMTRPTHAGGAGFASQWDAGFVHPIRSALIAQNDDNRYMNAIIGALTARYNDSAFQRVIYTESHDEVANGKARIPEEIWPGHADSQPAKKRSTLGAALVFTTPGIPMIFQGQEFLSDAWFQDQTALDWGKAERFGGILQIYSDLIKLRRNWHNTTRGLTGQHIDVYHAEQGSLVVAFHRWDAGGPQDSVVVVANFSSQTHSDYRIGMPASGLWRLRFNSDWQGYDQEFTGAPTTDIDAQAEPMDHQPASAALVIGPYSVVIFSQDG